MVINKFVTIKQLKELEENRPSSGGSSEITELKARIRALEIAMGAEITENRLAVIFSTTDDIEIAEGIWNESSATMMF